MQSSLCSWSSPSKCCNRGKRSHLFQNKKCLHSQPLPRRPSRSQYDCGNGPWSSSPYLEQRSARSFITSQIMHTRASAVMMGPPQWLNVFISSKELQQRPPAVSVIPNPWHIWVLHSCLHPWTHTQRWHEVSASSLLPGERSLITWTWHSPGRTWPSPYWRQSNPRRTPRRCTLTSSASILSHDHLNTYLDFKRIVEQGLNHIATALDRLQNGIHNLAIQTRNGGEDGGMEMTEVVRQERRRTLHS